MAWALYAHGDTSPEAEEELQARLEALLSSPKYGTLGSQLDGAWHNGPVHLKPKPARKKAAGNG